ncbi:hypothetical protein ACWEOW_14450 [Monashia sp. NPDC004114]
MTTQTLAPPTARRSRLLPPTSERRALAPAVIAVAFLLTEAVVQAVTPFIRNDDWPFLVPAHTLGVMSPGYYDQSEGRWLNPAWWDLVGQHGNATTASLTYAVGYAALVAGLWRVLHRSGIRPAPAIDVLLGIALFASCVWVQLLYWPGALTPSVLVAAAAIWLLPWAARSGRRLGVWLVVGEVAAVLSYPPVGVLLLVFAVVVLREARWRTVLSVVATWVAAFAVGVGVAYTLNWIVNGQFGLELASWRQPNPLHSVHSLEVNVQRWLTAAGSLWAAQWWVALAGVVGIGLGCLDADVRPRLWRLLVAFGVACGLDVAQTLTTGVVTDARGQLWTWLVAVLPVTLVLGQRRRLMQSPLARLRAGLRIRRAQPVDAVAAVTLAALAVGGVLTWRADIGEHQLVRSQYAAIAAAATAHAPGTVPPTVVVYQDPAERHTRSGKIMASTMFMAVRQDQGGVPAHWCTGRECLEQAAQIGSGSVIQLGQIGRHSDVVGVVVPTPPSWL